MEEFLYQLVEEGQLEIDGEGRIWRLKKRRGTGKAGQSTISAVDRRRAEHKVPSGYLQVRAMIGGERRHALAHRLVWRHFNGPIPDPLTVNHKNGDKGDNRPPNLELATHREQALHARTVLLVGRLDQRGELNPMAKLTQAVVDEIRNRRAMGEKLASIAADFDIAMQTVSKIARGDRWGT